MKARHVIGDQPFAVVLPDNLFQGPNQTAAVLSAWDRFNSAAVLIAEISSDEAHTKGATGKATVREEADGSLRVVDIADKGKGRFDTAGGNRAATPIGRLVLPASVFGEFDDIATSSNRPQSSTTFHSCSGSRDGIH